MKIKSLILLTSRIEEVRQFYEKTLGFAILDASDDMFSIQVGWSRLCFKLTSMSYLYHYCFLIPRNQLEGAMQWMGERVPIIDIQPGKKTVHFDSWNADSFYFYDPAGNIAECIAHNELDNDSSYAFDRMSLLAVNEIGLGIDNIEKINSILERQCASPFWKGDLMSFGTNGSAEGRVLIPDYNIKETWFPTNIKIEPVPVELLIECKGRLFRLVYSDGELSVLKIKREG